MTAYTLAANATLRDVGTAGIWGVATARTGGDTVDVNGFKLTIDQDSRYGFSGTTSTTWGTLTINASKGGEIHIDGSKVWLIPFTGGSGTLTLGTQITIGGVTCNTIGLYSSLTAAPVVTGVASGWLKVTNASGVPGTISSGTYAGYTITANGAAVRGWIEVNGDEASTITANRLGTFRVTGAWYELGTTSGASDQTLQIPNHGLSQYYAGVFIAREAPRASTYTWASDTITVTLSAHGFVVGQDVELAFSTGGITAASNGTFRIVTVPSSSTFTVALTGSGTGGNCTTEFLEFYPNAGTTTTTGTEATRGKVVWIDATGLVRIGNSGAATNGYTPASGLRVVVPNVNFQNNTTAARTANVIPNATIATRYDFTTTGGGVLEIDKGNFGWYLSVLQAYSLNMSNSGFVDSINIQEVATPMTWSKVGVGNKPTTALLVSPLFMYYCYAGGTITDSNFARVSLAAASAYTTVLQDIVGFTFTNCVIRANTIQGNATVYSIYGTRIKNTDFIRLTIIEAAANLITCDDVNFTDTVYCGCVSGTTVTTYAVSVWNISSNTINCIFSGLTWPVTNTHPYTAILVAATGCSGIKLRNIGTYASPLTMGSVNICGLIYTLATNCSDFKIQRVYVSATRTGIMTGDNSSHEVTEENVWGDYADAVDVMAVLNMKRKGMGGTGALTAQTSVYGTHWRDGHTSTTAGRISILMNEPTALTTAQVALTGGAAFTSAGGLYMPTVGQTATFEMPEYIIGHTGFANSALVMAGGTATNYTYEYAIDKNDGNGFSTMTSSAYTATTLGTALNGITGIDASKGFKLKLKITTGTGNTTAITSVYVTTTSTTTTQAYQYPLDQNTITFTGLVTGSDVTVTTSDTNTVVGSVDQTGPTSWGYTYSGAQLVDVKVIKAGYVPYVIYDLSLGLTDSTLPIAQVADRNYA